MKTEKLNPVQIMTLSTAAIFGVDILIFQQQMVSIARQDAWISLSIGAILTIGLGSLMYFLATLYPDKDLPGILIQVGGKFIGRLILLFNIAYVALYTGLSLRIFGQALEMFLLDRTPISAIIILMVIAVVYTVYQGIYAIGGVVDIIYPLCKITVIAIILLSLPQVNTSNIKPVFFENSTGVIKGILPGIQSFTGYGLISYIFCYTQKAKGTFKWYIAGMSIPIILYIALLVVTIMTFSAPGIPSLIYPTLTLTKSIEFPTTFLERLESFAAILWIAIVFESLVVFTFASTRNFTVFLGIEKKYERYIALAHIPLLVTIALIIDNTLTVIQYFNLIKYMQSFLGIVITPTIVVVALIKKRKEKRK